MDSKTQERMCRILRHRLLNVATGVKGANQLLASGLDDRLTVREKEYFPLISRECDHLCYVVERLESLMGPLAAVVPAPLQSTVCTIMEELGRRHPRAEIYCEENVAECGRMVCSSTVRVLLFEAVDNAYELSKKPVSISIRDQGESCLIRVVDQGPALSTEVREMAFEPFYTTRTRHVGVGLSIALRWLTRQGGSAAMGVDESGNFVEFVLPYIES